MVHLVPSMSRWGTFVLSCLMWREAEGVGAEDGVGDDILGLGGEGKATVGAGRATGCRWSGCGCRGQCR